MLPDSTRAYGVTLLLERPITLDVDDLLKAFQERCGHTELMTANEGILAFWFHDIPLEAQSIPVPPQLLITPHKTMPARETFTEALQQSWLWFSAAEAVAASQAALNVMDFMASGLHYQSRLQLFYNALGAILTVVPCKAIHWQASQKLISPDDFQRAQKDHLNLLYGAINIRLFRIEGRRKDEMLMDSLGMSALGLPDVQCHFANLDPNDMARVLFNTANYMFEQGDVIQNGHTVPGINATDKWRCQHEDALIPPNRVVLDLDPGKPYAAGIRN